MSGDRSRIPLAEAVAAVRRERGPRDVVITTMAASKAWMDGGTGPLDFVFVPSCMGHATSLGLGLALAQPRRRIIVCNGDGSMLMNLGSLVSIMAAAPPNLVVLVLDNGVYEVTGAQPTPGSPVARPDQGRVDYAAMARACGFPSVFHCPGPEEWRRDAAAIITAPGPVFAWLEIEAVRGRPGPRSPGPAAARARAFMQALRDGAE